MNYTVGFSQCMFSRSCFIVILNFVVFLKTCGYSGDARRMDSTAFVVGGVDRKFGPGPTRSVNPFCTPRIGVGSPTIGAVFSFPAAPSAPQDSVFSVHSPSCPWERLH